MKKITSLLFFFLWYVSISNAQDNIPVRALPTEVFRNVKKDPKDDTAQWHWKRAGVFNLNMAQGSLSNWAAGGDNFSLALSSYVNYFVLHKKGNHTWDSNLDFNFGFIQTTTGGSRKNDDRIDILSKYGYRVDTTNKLYVSALFNFRSQFFDGLTYYSRDSSSLASTFLSPAYILLSIGMDYKPFKDFSLFLSPLTNRTTVVTSKRLNNKDQYGVPAGKSTYNELGAFASINYYKPLFKNVTYKGRVDLFTNYQQKPQNVDFYMTNLFTFKINKFLSATYNLDMIYDDNVKLFGTTNDSPALQLKSLIGIGFQMPIKVKSL